MTYGHICLFFVGLVSAPLDILPAGVYNTNIKLIKEIVDSYVQKNIDIPS